MSDNENKPHVSICISGTVDSGKSTLTGHLCFKLGALDQRTMQKLQEKADALGKSSFSFAFFTDTAKEERERGITIQATTKEFFTNNYHYSVADCPGHRDFLKNMIIGSSQVDSAILICPADSNFTAAIQKADPENNIIEGQTRAHSRILNLLGIKQLICLINKMDEKSVNFSEERFKEVADEFKDVLIKTGWKKEFVEKSVPIIPLSAWTGDNLMELSDKMPWFKGYNLINANNENVHVHTLLDALDKLICLPKLDPKKPLRLPISNVYNIPGIGEVLAGRIEQGTIKPNDEFILLPRELKGRVFSVEMHHRSMPQATAGDNVGVNVKKAKGLDWKAEAGDIMISASDTSIKPVLEFKALIQVVSCANELKVGYTPVACIRTQKTTIKLTKIFWKIGKETGGKKLEEPTSIKTGENAEVLFSAVHPICVEKFSDCEGLGRILILEGNTLAIVAKITEIIKTK